MKKQLLFFILLTTGFTVKAQSLIIQALSENSVMGITEKGYRVIVDTNLNGVEDYGVDVDSETDDFTLPFLPPLTGNKTVWNWAEKKEGTSLNRSEVKTMTVENDLSSITTVEKDSSNAAKLKNTTSFSNAIILTTNFNIPVARFDFLSKSAQTDSKGNITLFNSVGAGLGINFGEKKTVYNDKGEATEQDFSNIVGLHLGVLFSAGTGEDTNNVFAPVVNLTILDFQIGVGWELGDVAPNMSGTFMTVSYAIPLYKLSRTGFFTLSEKERKSSEKPNEDSGERSKFSNN